MKNLKNDYNQQVEHKNNNQTALDDMTIVVAKIFAR